MLIKYKIVIQAMMGARVVTADFRQVTGVTCGKTTVNHNKKKTSTIKKSLNKEYKLIKKIFTGNLKHKFILFLYLR